MATQKERDVISEIVSLACDVNMTGNVAVTVDVDSYGVSMRISPPKISDADDWQWIYYPKCKAYFQDEVFESSNFDDPTAEFIAELKKHHPAYDSDGVKL